MAYRKVAVLAETNGCTHAMSSSSLISLITSHGQHFCQFFISSPTCTLAACIKHQVRELLRQYGVPSLRTNTAALWVRVGVDAVVEVEVNSVVGVDTAVEVEIEIAVDEAADVEGRAMGLLGFSAQSV